VHHALRALKDATAASEAPSSGEVGDGAAGSLALPPLPQLLERCLASPVAEACARADPLLLAVISAKAPPRAVFGLLCRLLLFAEPALTAPVFDTVFAKLQHHGQWRRQLSALTTALQSNLVDAGVPEALAELVSLRVHPSALSASVAGETGTHAAVPVVGGGVGGGAARGLDTVDIRALDALELVFEPRWPMHLFLTARGLLRLQQVRRRGARKGMERRRVKTEKRRGLLGAHPHRAR
jgi:hypothetical protein